MRHYQSAILLIIVLLLVYVIWATASITVSAAQIDDPAPVATTEAPSITDNLEEDIYYQATQASLAAADARRYAEDAAATVGTQLDTANDLLALFESVTAIVGILIPVLVFFGGFFGFREINQARENLEEARKRFEKDVEEKTVELQQVRAELEKSVQLQREVAGKMRDELRQSVQEQRDAAYKANLALSLLPIGERQYRAGDYAGAIDLYERALQLDPDSVITYYRLGYVYTQSGNLDKAQQNLKRALEIEQDFAPALACLGYVYRRIGEEMETGIERNMMFDQASIHLSSALKKSPKLIDDDNESWWGSLGGLYRRRDQIADAIYAYEQAAEATPYSSYPLSNLALLYARSGDHEKMREMYKRVEEIAWGEVQADLDNYWGFADLLTSRLALGKWEKAEESLAAVFRTVPSNSRYAFESLLDTLERLQKVTDKSEPMQSFIMRIRSSLNTKNNKD